jgi:hypothetical protein
LTRIPHSAQPYSPVCINTLDGLSVDSRRRGRHHSPMEEQRRDRDESEELLRRALVDSGDAAAVALNVEGLPVSQAVTLIFHGRRDLGTIQTYVAPGDRHAGDQVAGDELLRVPCDLDLAEAEDRDEAERLYAEQAAAMRDALVGADTVLDVWREPLAAVVGGDRGVSVDRSLTLDVTLPAHRLLPVALVAPDRHLVVVPVCSARTLAAGRPPMGIACAQQDVVRIYPLPDDPERCLDDFLGHVAEHSRVLAQRIEHDQTSVERFMELSDDLPEAG